MHEISKFQIVTVAFLAMFIFIIGALYTNTKDAVESKNSENYSQQQMDEGTSIKNRNRVISQDKMELQALSDRISALEQRPQVQPQNRIQNSGDFNLRCKIRGIIEDGSIVYMAEDDAVQEAKVNNKDLVMNCSY